VRVAVLGVGLIGGSIGLAARGRAGARVCGYDPDPRARELALELGAVDEVAPNLAAAVAGAEVVFAAAPVGALAGTVREALALAGPECAVSDVGSTKLALDDARRDPRFVGGHPLTGAETSGVAHAREDLFEGATWYLTPTPSTDEGVYERLRRLIVSFGAEPIPIDAKTHDRLMASVSHLPHVLANLLVAQVAAAHRDSDQPALVRTLGMGPSFRDATRVAGANTAIWTDIYLANREALVAAIDEAVERLAEVRATLHSGDAQAIAAWNERARVDRETLLGPDS
jgi:prephenate dehydrogenase